jgi:hypothetical protein
MHSSHYRLTLQNIHPLQGTQHLCITPSLAENNHDDPVASMLTRNWNNLVLAPHFWRPLAFLLHLWISSSLLIPLQLITFVNPLLYQKNQNYMNNMDDYNVMSILVRHGCIGQLILLPHVHHPWQPCLLAQRATNVHLVLGMEAQHSRPITFLGLLS